MIHCPTCSRKLSDLLLCKCGTDLSLLKHIIASADHLFNQAINAYRNDQIAQALEYLEANSILVPSDIEARVFQTKLLAYFERWDEYKIMLQGIKNTDPNHPELATMIHLSTEEDGNKK